MADANADDINISSDLEDLRKVFKELSKNSGVLDSTTKTVSSALQQYGSEVQEATKIVSDTRQELNEQKMALSRLKSAYGQYSNTLNGIISIGVSEIAVSLQRRDAVKAELTRAQELARLQEEDVNNRIKLIKDSEVLSAIQSKDADTIQKLTEARQENLRYLQSQASKANEEIQLIDNRKAVLEQHSQYLKSELSSNQAMLKAMEEIEREGGTLSDEDLAYRRQLIAANQTLISRLDENIRHIEHDNVERDKLESVLDSLGVAIREETQNIEDLNAASTLGKMQKAVDDFNKLLNTETWKSINEAGELAQNLAKSLRELEQIVRKTQNEFGISAGQAANLKFSQLGQAISSATTAIFTLGGRAAVSMEEIQAAQAEFQKEFGGVISSDAAEKLASQAKEMGVSVSELAKARRVFLTTALGDVGKAIDQQNRAIAAFEAKGLTAKDAMQFIGNNAELVARAGSRFQDSLMRAAAEAKQIGVDLSKVNQVGDNIIGNFEGFLESMAELGAMGFGFDTSALAEIAESGDTSALFDELRSQLAMQGKDLTDLRRSEQLALSRAFGMDIGEFQRLAGETPEGGGETMEDMQKESNVLLGRLTNIVGGLSAAFGGLSTLIGVTHTAIFLKQLATLSIIAANLTGKAFGSVIEMVKNSRMGGAVGRAGGVAARVGRGIGIGAIATLGGAAITNVGESLKEQGKLKSGSAVSTLGTAAKGAGYGAMIGSIIPGVGTVFGAAIGGLIGTIIGVTKNLEGFKSIFSNVFGAIADAFNFVITKLKQFGSWIGSWISKIVTFITSFTPMYLIETISKFIIGRKTGLPTGDDVVSRSGYGDRTLVTQSGAIALNNRDTVVAYADDMISNEAESGVRTLSLGTIAGNQKEVQPTVLDTSRLEREVIRLGDRIERMQVSLDGIQVGKVIFANQLRAAQQVSFRDQGTRLY